MPEDPQSENSNAILNLKGNVVACIPREINLMTPYVLLEQEDWFENEINFVRSLARHVNSSFDIGANFGLYSLALANGGALHNQVWSFEPMDPPRSFFEQSIVSNDFNNIKVVDVALSSFSGSANMYGGANTELSTLNKALAQEDSQEKIVAVRTLDDFCTERELTEVDFIKIDAEGEEENVIWGGHNLLKSCTPLVMFEIDTKSTKFRTVANILEDASYDIYRHCPGLNCLVPIDLDANIDPFQLNLFCCKPDRAGWLATRELLVLSSAGRLRPEMTAGSHAQSELAKYLHSNFHSNSFDFDLVGRESDQVSYLYSISCYGLAQDENRNLSERFALLEVSFDTLRELCANQPTRSRLMTLARVASDFGAQTLAVRTLSQLEKNFQTLEYNDKEAFLPASQRFDSIDPQENRHLWMRACVSEQKLVLSAYSSYFADDDYLDALDRLRDMHFFGAEIERRWQLMRMLRGKQSGIQATEFLARRPQGILGTPPAGPTC